MSIIVPIYNVKCISIMSHFVHTENIMRIWHLIYIINVKLSNICETPCITRVSLAQQGIYIIDIKFLILSK